MGSDNMKMVKLTVAGLYCMALLSFMGCGEVNRRHLDGDNDPPSGSASSSSSSTSSSSSGDATPDDGSAMEVQHHTPAAGSTRTALVSTIQITFTQPVLDGSFDSDLITLFSGDGLVEGTLRQLSNRIFEFIPDNRFTPGTEYQVVIGDIMSVSGEEYTGFAWAFTTAGDIGNTPQSTVDACMNDLDIRMLAAVNQARGQSRLCGNDNMPAADSLSWNCDLRQAAQLHSNDMTRNNFFSHSGSNGSSAGDRVSNTNYSWSAVRENLAAGQQNVQDVMAGLLKSPGHCVNIMARDVIHFGFGYAENRDTQYTRYWTQVFASPRR